MVEEAASVRTLIIAFPAELTYARLVERAVSALTQLYAVKRLKEIDVDGPGLTSRPH